MDRKKSPQKSLMNPPEQDFSDPFSDPLAQAQDWLARGRDVALATVIESWGSAPRPPGAILAINDQGAMSGSVSGGCVEGAVVARALELIAEKAEKPEIVEFGVSDETAWEVGLSCGGKIRIFLERIAPD